MADPIFKDSTYRFTDPIRYFKANDPYYWEVENIPLKQIHENMLWLKDQIGPQARQFANVTRRDLSELKPYATEEDNLIRVMPGRYTARVNNAYKLDNQFQFLEQMAGDEWGFEDRWKAKLLNHDDILPIIEKLQGKAYENYLGLNGLIDGIYTYPVKDIDTPHSEWVNSTSGPHLRHGQDKWSQPFPLTDGTQLASHLESETTSGIMEDVGGSNFKTEGLGFFYLGGLDAKFIRQWRGTSRTAIVDVPEELSIEIPRFAPEEYTFINADGEEEFITGATNRIDLLFIYSKPVDTSSVYIGKYPNDIGPLQKGGEPIKITKAELGLVHGAGIGMNFQQILSGDEDSAITDLQDEAGTRIMLPNVADQKMTSAGFQKIGAGVYGSFPAPDDLMNISPLLAEDLESNNPMLVGQSILPLAYIVTRDSDFTNNNNVNIVTEDSIVDIRPFLRTTELSFNERAGISAAMPQISYANPAVGKAQVDREMMRAKEYTDQQIAGIEHPTVQILGQNIQDIPRVVATGYVFGGTNWGVEGALMDALQKKDTSLSFEEALVQTKADCNYPKVNYAIGGDEWSLPSLPGWDQALWLNHLTGPKGGSKGSMPNDYINVHINRGSEIYNGPHHSLDITEGQCMQQDFAAGGIRHFGTNNTHSYNPVVIHYCSKTIPIIRSAAINGWMQDYNVEVELLNCVPISAPGTSHNTQAGGTANCWVEKSRDYFTIFVSWFAQDYMVVDYANQVAEHGGVDHGSIRVGQDVHYHSPVPNADIWGVPRNHRTLQSHFAGFSVINSLHREFETGYSAGEGEAFKGETQAGICIYPTVSFTITGIPEKYVGQVVKIPALGINLI